LQETSSGSGTPANPSTKQGPSDTPTLKTPYTTRASHTQPNRKIRTGIHFIMRQTHSINILTIPTIPKAIIHAPFKENTIINKKEKEKKPDLYRIQKSTPQIQLLLHPMLISLHHTTHMTLVHFRFDNIRLNTINTSPHFLPLHNVQPDTPNLRNLNIYIITFFGFRFQNTLAFFTKNKLKHIQTPKNKPFFYLKKAQIRFL
jgi:hypothetical protein